MRKLLFPVRVLRSLWEQHKVATLTDNRAVLRRLIGHIKFVGPPTELAPTNEPGCYVLQGSHLRPQRY